MNRVDLPELEDASWLPAWIRDSMTLYLQTVIDRMRPYDVVLPTLAELLDGSEAPRVVDLASGAGGPWPSFASQLRERCPGIRITLTDIHPNRTAAEKLSPDKWIEYSCEPTSALESRESTEDVRTCFTALHHFEPAEVRTILLSAQQDGVAFLAAEATQRSWKGVLAAFFIPILVWALMPSVQPRRFSRLLFTYCPPLLPILITWDGLASTLKSYSQAEIEDVVRDIEAPGYRWEVKELRVVRSPLPVLCVTGRPVRRLGGQTTGT